MSKFVGIGACGNKAVIKLLEDSIIIADECTLLNTTHRDIPADYRDLFVKFGNGRGGCGKRTDLAYNLFMDAVDKEELNVLDDIIETKDETIYIVTSLRGGTGCGATIGIVEYYLAVHPTNNISIIAFDGFDDDVRGMKNSIEFFQKLPKGVTIQVIDNKKFLEESNNDKMGAEALANQEFSNRMKYILGKTIVDGWKNIDDEDLYNATTTNGYMTVEYGKLPTSLKNREMYNKEVAAIIVNSKSLDVLQPGAQRLAIILNTNDQIKGNIDHFHTVIREKFGTSGEVYEHFQNGAEPGIAIIASGMRMPLEEVKATLQKYEEGLSKIRRDDNFFSELSNISTGDLNMFDKQAESEVAAEVDVSDRRKAFLKNKSNVVVAKMNTRSDMF